MKYPKTFGLDMGNAELVRKSMAGQRFIEIIGPNTAPGSPLSQIGIMMTPGQVSDVHWHDDTDVYVHVSRVGKQGVLTLAGENLEHAEWTFQGETLWIPQGSGVKHVAIYPRDPAGNDHTELLAIETRRNPDPQDDIHPAVGYGKVLTGRLDELGLRELVNLPSWAVG